MPRRQRREHEPEQSAYSARQEQPFVVDLNADQRAEMALHLHVMGYTYAEIARRLGYANHTGALKAVKRLRARLPVVDAQDAIAVQFMRIERGVLACMEFMEQQPPKDRLWALDRLVPLLKRQAELLGIDARPNDQELTTLYTRKIVLVHDSAAALPPAEVIDGSNN